MTLDKMEKLFKKHSDGDTDEFLKFERIKNPRHKRPDLCAYLLLDELCPDTRDIVSGAEHDEIYLAVRPEDLAAVITEDQIEELTRCGVRHDSSNDCMCMFV